MISVLSILLFRRTDVETTLLRAAGTLYQLKDDGTVSNLYNAEIMNKTNHSIRLNIQPVDPSVKIQYIQKVGLLEKGGSTKLTFFISRPQKGIEKYKSEIKLNVLSGNVVLEKLKTTFIAPPN